MHISGDNIKYNKNRNAKKVNNTNEKNVKPNSLHNICCTHEQHRNSGQLRLTMTVAVVISCLLERRKATSKTVLEQHTKW
jgi:hypothetical protein